MQIDWFTYGAQIVNFLILVYLLRRFLYGPIRQAMTTRRADLQAQFVEAARKAAEAEAVVADFEQRAAALAEQKSAMLAAATAEVDRRRRAMVLAARTEVEAMQQRWYAAVEHDKANFLHELRVRVSAQLFAATRDVLRDLAHAELEAAMVATFCDKLGALDDATRHSMARSLRNGTPVVIINSSFHLDEPLRQQVGGAVQQLLAAAESGREIHLRFRQNTHLIMGIELVVQERRLAWSVADHLANVEKQLSRALDDALAAHDDHAPLLATPLDAGVGHVHDRQKE